MSTPGTRLSEKFKLKARLSLETGSGRGGRCHGRIQGLGGGGASVQARARAQEVSE